jgi:hypothetical protein
LFNNKLQILHILYGCENRDFVVRSIDCGAGENIAEEKMWVGQEDGENYIKKNSVICTLYLKVRGSLGLGLSGQGV